MSSKSVDDDDDDEIMEDEAFNSEDERLYGDFFANRKTYVFTKN